MFTRILSFLIMFINVYMFIDNVYAYKHSKTLACKKIAEFQKLYLNVYMFITIVYAYKLSKTLANKNK